MATVSKKFERLESFELKKLAKVTRSKSVLEQQEDFEEAVLVWLDTTLKDANQWTEEFDYIRELMNNVKVFHRFDECVSFLKTIVDEKVFLIVSHDFVHPICSIKSELRSITAIYVYFDEKIPLKQQNQLKQWTHQNEPLITGFYSSPSDSFPQLTRDINDICDHDTIPVNYFNSKNRNFNGKETGAFLISFFFWKNLLYHLPSMSLSQQQRSFNSSLHYYRDNDQRLAEIQHFQQHYSADLAIDWYFRTRFLTRALNKASRTQNLTLLINYRFLFHDIQRLIDQYRSQLTETSTTRMIYYRAQNLNADELFRLRTNVGGLISINRYLELCKTAEEAVNEVSLVSNTLETVLYHISLDESCLSISESKILLPIGSIFLIRYFTMEIDGIWHVHLNPISSKELQEWLRMSLEELEDIPHPFLGIGLVFEKLKQTGRADRFYRLLIQNLPEQKDETALVCNYIGCICRLKCQFTAALTYHQRALGIYQHLNLLDSSFDSIIMGTYAQIALAYRDMGDCLSAIAYFNLAMKFGKDEQIFNHLAEIYRNVEQFSLAQQFYQQTDGQNNIGLCYVYQRLFPEAFSHLQQQQTNSTCFINLAFHHQLRKEYDTALTYFNTALELVKDHPFDTAMIHSYLGLLFCDRRQWTLSLKHYEKALEMYKNLLWTQNHPTIALIHDGIGTLYLRKGEFRAAQHEFERCLDLQTRVLPSQHPDIAGTYNNLAGVYNEMGSYEQALLYHYEALAIATSTLPADHADVKLYEHNIAETKRKLS